MPDLLTPQVLAAAGPLIVETMFKHYLGPKNPSQKDGKSKEELMYDEAFVLMKTFLEISTKHPVAALQRFGQVRTPAPPWVAVHRLQVPHPSLLSAAEYLITAFGGEEMACKIAGGTKWWQVRAGQGVEAEWIVMKKDWRDVVAEEKTEKKDKKGKLVKETIRDKEKEKEKSKDKDEDSQLPREDEGGDDGEFRPEMDRLRCMLYIHGGAYYWGSINTHRYTIWRHARKMHGRCFAVNYRKAPQYPFPCALQDCLAAYIYLTNPPPGAKHRPVDPKSIILAGDSAGGGLCLALLQILRDTPGLELPAGAVLISPWSDLTHSFPSILENTATDVVPPYGFIHKPSSLWPPPPPVLTEQVQSRLRTRVKEAVSQVRERERQAAAAAAGTSKTTGNEEQHNSFLSRISTRSTVREKEPSSPVHASDPKGGVDNAGDKSTSELRPMAEHGDARHPAPQGEIHHPNYANPALLYATLSEPSKNETRPTTLAQCSTPLMLQVKGEEVVLDTQIQLYATNAQICHPFVSPVLGYMGGLPPVYVMCGDNEVLRDEIIYLAHKMANPDKYPIREDVRAMLPSLQGIEERYGPTNVHLQVYDGACHDLPLFSMTHTSRGCFRAIASFARYVTPSAPGSLYIGGKSRPGTGSGSGSKRTPGLPVTPNTATSMGSEMRRGESAGGETGSSGVPSLALPVGQHADHDGEAVFPDQARVTSSPVPLSSPLPSHPKLPSSGLQAHHEIPSRRGSTTSSLAFPSAEVTATPSSSSLDTTDTPHARAPELERGILPPRYGGGSGSDSRVASAQASPQLRPVGSESHSGIAHGHGEGLGLGEVSTEGWESRQDSGVGGISGLDDSRAKEGESGWPGIYRGANPFTDHMIRERVSQTGITRPLSPPSDLSAMTMPASQIGMIKEGAAMRYINGQALWDKKYKRAGNRVKKKRERNLKMARKAGEGRVEAVVREKMRREKEKAKEKVMTKKGGKHDEKAGAGMEDGHQTESVEEFSGSGEENSPVDNSWNWTWAVNGESPPPSAIVSRRDFSEARQLALMADRIDSAHQTQTPLHGLSMWVGLAAFFGGGSDRDKTLEVVREAARHSKDIDRDEEEGSSTRSIQSGKEKPKKRFGRFFKWGKKD
ncbi:hypothetical protein IAT38_001774 [Cryptococcus sp. DSM 104549]